MVKVYVTKNFSFEAAHSLPNYEGDCSNLHGHSYKMQVTVSGGIHMNVPEDGSYPATECMVIDFKELKRIVKTSILQYVDHKNLNDLYPYPTAEYMVVNFFHVLNKSLPMDVELVSVKLWETADSFAEYRGEFI